MELSRINLKLLCRMLLISAMSAVLFYGCGIAESDSATIMGPQSQNSTGSDMPDRSILPVQPPTLGLFDDRESGVLGNTLPDPECVKYGTADLSFYNISSAQTYKVIVHGFEAKLLEPQTVVTFTLPQGLVQWEIIELTEQIVKPVYGEMKAVQCNSYWIRIPKITYEASPADPTW